MFIPEGFASVAFVVTDATGEDLGTPEYVYTTAISNPLLDDWQDVANLVDDEWKDAFSPVTIDTFSLERTVLTVSDGAGGTGTIESTNPPVPGTRVSDPGFTVFAPKVRKLTARIGRKGRGVTHPAGVLALSDITNSGIILEARRTAILDAFNAFGLAVATAGYVPVLLHSNEADGAPDALTGATVGAKVGVLRNRIV